MIELFWNSYYVLVLLGLCQVGTKSNPCGMCLSSTPDWGFCCCHSFEKILSCIPVTTQDQARGRLGQNSLSRGRNFALDVHHGEEVGVSLIFFFFWGGETRYHSVTIQTQAVVTIYYHCIVFLLPLNGNNMCYG